MTVWNIVGNTNATIGPEGLPTGAYNDMGSIRGAGNLGDTTRWSAIAITEGNNYVITVVSGTNGVSGALAAGAFNAGDQVIRRVTTDIAGVTNNILLYGSDSANKATNLQKTKVKTFYYKTAVRANSWEILSGRFWPAVAVGYTGAWSQETDTDVSEELVASGVDTASNPTASIPGKLTFRAGAPLPSGTNYAARTLF
jgi:hypothetical protein